MSTQASPHILPRAAIYVRISADPEGQRAGVERQRAECEATAERLGLSVVGVYEDNDISAYSGKPRPDFERLIADADAGRFGAVVAWSSDRLYRRVEELTRITKELATRAHIVTVMGGEVDLTTAEGIMRAQVLGSVAEFESRRKGERVAARARQRAAEGRTATATRPLGWQWRDPCPGGPLCPHKAPTGACVRPRKGSKAGLEPHPVEAAALREAYVGIRSGDSLRTVTRRMAEVVPTGTRGGTLAPFVVRGALLAPRNAGLATLHGEVVGESADGLSIVDRATFERVRAILEDPKRRTAPGRPAGTPLSGLLTCGKCGGPMNATNRWERGTPRPAYVCARHKHLSRARALLDGPALALVGEVLAVLAGRGDLVAPGSKDSTGPIRDQIAGLEARRDALAALVTSGALDPADYAKAAARIRAELEALARELTRAVGRPALVALGDDVAGAWASLREQAEAGDADPLRGVLAELVDHIDVLPAAVPGQPTQRDVRIVWRDWLPGEPPTRPTADARARYTRRDERRAQVARLHGEGLTVRELAARFGVTDSTIRLDLDAAGARRIVHRPLTPCG